MNFNGQLNPNEIFGSIYNMIISQQVFGDNFNGKGYASLVEDSRVDGSMYGDTKVYYSADVLKSAPWGNDAEAANLLELHRPADPKCQKITLDVFRQIALTVDNYLSKRAWSTESAFSQFNSVIKGMISNTKKVYDQTLYNTYIGTVETAKGKQTQAIEDLPTGTGEEANRLEAQGIATFLADLLTDLTDISRDYNDYGILRTNAVSDLRIVWNAQYKNKITKFDLPTIFHKDGLFGDLKEYVLPERYFGKVKTAGTTPSSNTTIRSLVEKDFGEKHCFPGDLLPDSTVYGENEAYEVDNKIIFKIMNKKSCPIMSGFEVGTSFFNPKSLTETNYLTWGHNTLDYLENYPMITVRDGRA